LTDQLAPDGGRGSSIERNRAEFWEVTEEVPELIVLGLADRLIEAAAATGRRDYVPKADPPVGQALEPRVIVK
jgi:hypothetical protein